MRGLAPNEDLLWAEGVRVVPGILAAQETDDCVGVAVLLRDYHHTALALGVADGRAWQMLWMASMHWSRQMVGSLAEIHGMAAEEVCRSMAAQSAAWVSETHGVGGV